MNMKTLMSGLQLALRAGLAAGLSFAIASALRLEHPIYAMIAAIIVTDLTPSRSRQLGLHRIAATVIGAVCGGLCSSILPPNPWTLGVGIAAAMLVSHLLQGTDGVRVAAFVFGIVMIEHGSDPWHYALQRLIETLLGIAVAWSISHVPKLIKIEDAEGGEGKQEDEKRKGA
jgi:uncharacterized membrane protein YgaE (UPF0421/DUF939 family)